MKKTILTAAAAVAAAVCTHGKNLEFGGVTFRIPEKGPGIAVVENGKGIEVNTSGLRHPALNVTIPTPDILRLYRELGGERITVGSDAHRTVDAGKGVQSSFELLRSLGFKYVCAYRKRQPEFIKL